MGPYAARLNNTAENARSVPGLLHAPKVSRRKGSPSHHAVMCIPVRHTYAQPASSTVGCRSVPSHAPSPSHTTCAPSGMSPLTNSTRAIGSSSGKCPWGPWRTRQASGSARPLSTTWILRALPPRPTTLPSITNTTLCKAQCCRKMWAYGKKYLASKMWAWATHLAKCLTRLST